MNITKLCLLGIGIFVFSCNAIEPVELPTDSSDSNELDELIIDTNLKTPEAQAFVSDNNNFAFDLFKAVAQDEAKENYMISPLSVSMGLGMLSNGAAGETKTTFEDVIGNGTSTLDMNIYNKLLIDTLTTKSGGTSFNLANSIWVQEGLHVQDDFLDVNRIFYNSTVENVNFGSQMAKDKINSWASENTNGKIDDIADGLSVNTVMALLNAIYFKSVWKYTFNSTLTREASFFPYDGDTKKVMMMKMKEDIHWFSNDQFSSIILPYEEERFEMVLLIPNGNYITSDIINNLSVDFLAQIEEEGAIYEDLEVYLPRFRTEYDIDLKIALESLGLSIYGSKGDFSNINSSISISEIRQNTFIEVNEEGTEAAAVIIGSGVTSARPRFRGSRPFLYLIKEKYTGAICFIGHMGDPSI